MIPKQQPFVKTRKTPSIGVSVPLLVRRETGKELMVQVHYGEGVANHTGPEPYGAVREDSGEASAYSGDPAHAF